MRTPYAVSILLLFTGKAFCMTPDEVVSAMRQRYLQCESYEDAGIFHNVQHAVESLPQHFTTHFARSNAFRFEWSESGEVRNNPKPPHYHVTFSRVLVTGSIWSERPGSYRFDKMTSYPGRTSARGDIVHEQGGSGTPDSSEAPAPIIAALLSGVAGPLDFSRLTELQFMPEATLRHVNCYHIKGFDKALLPFDVWIGKQDLLIHKFERNDIEYEFTDVKITSKKVP